jgi:hypothetical protein
MFRRIIAATAVPLLLLAACTIPTDERAAPYDPDDLPPAIANTTTTSTTTTTTTTTTIAPPVTGGSAPETTATTTTTLPPSVTETAELYYTIGISDDLRVLQRQLPADPTTNEILAQLHSPLPDVGELGLRSSVRPTMVAGVSIERGSATVALDRETLSAMSDPTLRRAIAQLVLTLTEFNPPDEGGIGTVRFEVDGEGFAVFVPSFGTNSEPGELLAFSDFASLIATTSAPTTTTTTTSVPPEPAPPGTVEG